LEQHAAVIATIGSPPAIGLISRDGELLERLVTVRSDRASKAWWQRVRRDQAANGRSAMRRAVFLVSLFGLLLGVATHSFGGAAEQRPRSALADVAALDKLVTYTEVKIPLGELVRKVAADTGAPLTAARDVADEPVAVIVKELPARELLEQLADLLDYRWSPRQKADGTRERLSEKAKDLAGNSRGSTPGAGGPPASFEIWQDLASKQREEALRRATAGDVEKRFQESLKRYLEIGAMTPEQIQELAKSPQPIQGMEKLSPEERQAVQRTPEFYEKAQRWSVARTLTSPLPRTLAGLVGGITPQQWAVLRAGRPLTLSTDPQPGELRLPADVERTFRKTQPIMYPPGMNIRFSDPNGEERMRQQEKQMQEQWAAATGFQVVLRLDGDLSRSRGSINLRAEPRPVRSGAPGPPGGSFFFGGGMGTNLYISAGPVDGRQQMQENTLQRTAELEKDPVVGVKLPFKPEAKPQTDPFGPGSGPRWRAFDFLPDLARTYGVQILADAYSSNNGMNFGTLPSTTAPTALFTLLDRYTQFSHRWDRQGKLIRLRSRTWFLDRPREIPVRLVRQWKEQQEQHGALPLNTYLEMATTLTDAQLDGLNTFSPEMNSLNLFEVSRGRHSLRLYASLSPAQRQQLGHGGILTVAQLTLLQRRLFLSSLQETNRSRPQPMNLDQWSGGSFSVSTQRFTRIVEKSGNTTRTRMEAVDPPPGAPAGTAVQRVAGATQSTAVPGAPTGNSPPPPRPGAPPAPADSVSRFPVMRLEFKLQYAPEQVDRVFLTVPAQP
jgi:hypothetical protein